MCLTKSARSGSPHSSGRRRAGSTLVFLRSLQVPPVLHVSQRSGTRSGAGSKGKTAKLRGRIVRRARYRHLTETWGPKIVWRTHNSGSAGGGGTTLFPQVVALVRQEHRVGS